MLLAWWSRRWYWRDDLVAGRWIGRAVMEGSFLTMWKPSMRQAASVADRYRPSKYSLISSMGSGVAVVSESWYLVRSGSNCSCELVERDN